MADENDPDRRDVNGEASFKTPIFSASFRGKDIQLRDLLLVLVLVIVVLSGYVWWEHKNEASAGQRSVQEILKDGQRDLSFAIKELAVSQREMVQAQREQNCLIAIPQEIRESRANFCKQITR